MGLSSCDRIASPSLDPVASHACGMTVDEEERRHIFVVYNKNNDDGSSRDKFNTKILALD